MSDDTRAAVDQQPVDGPASLRPATARLVETRVALHRLAEEVISPARRAATTKIGLRATPGGFGTPPFGDGVQIRVAGTELVCVDPGGERRRAISTLTAAADLVGRDLLPGDVGLDDAPLPIDADSAALIADWFALGANVLLDLRTQAGERSSPSLIQLWPEHFDLAIELGSEAAGARANYGFSPGDDANPRPYAYVGPWVAPPAGTLWNATSFPGAQLGYEEVATSADPHATLAAFMRVRMAALDSQRDHESR